MKLRHDQVLRNIYKLVDEDTCTDSRVLDELRSSAALPASWYKGQFKNLKHVIEVCLNEQNTSFNELYLITDALISHLQARSIKQLRMPQEFYDLLIDALKRVRIQFYLKDRDTAIDIINGYLDKSSARYGYEATRKMLDKYKENNDFFNHWYDPDNTTPGYQEAWQKYFDYSRSIKLPSYWRYLRVFENLKYQVNKC